MLKRLSLAVAGLVLSGCASNGGLFSAKTPRTLQPYGVNANSPASIHMVTSPTSPVNKGDTIVSVNDHPVTAYSFYSVFTPKGKMQVRNADGKVRIISNSQMLTAKVKALKAIPSSVVALSSFRRKSPPIIGNKPARLSTWGQNVAWFRLVCGTLNQKCLKYI